MQIIQGDSLEILKTLPDQCVQTCVTSPPYWGLRNYGVDGQLGLEETPEAYVRRMVDIFREVRRVLKNDGTLWLNLGDCYAQSSYGQGGGWALNGSNYPNPPSQYRSVVSLPKYEHGLKPKDLVGIPWRVAFALQEDGWYLRQDIIWHKPNPMPESVRDRCTKAHEYIFLLSKSQRYYFNIDAIREPHQDKAGTERFNVGMSGKSHHDYEHRKWSKRTDGIARPPMTMKDRQYHPLGRNKRTVWTVNTKPYKGAHFATFPPDLIRPCILAGAAPGYTVLDPFTGSGTTGQVALELERRFLGIELNGDYIKLARERIAGAQEAACSCRLLGLGQGQGRKGHA